MRAVSTMLGTLVAVPILYLTAFKELGFPNSWEELAALVMAPPSLHNQLQLLVILAIIYGIAFAVLPELLFKWIVNSARYRSSLRRRWSWEKSIYANFDIITYAQYEAFQRVNGCKTMLIDLQHLCGGLLCAPLCFGFLPAAPGGLGFALARLGALSEAGWELEDTVVRFSMLLLGWRTPADIQMLIVMCLHHVAGAMVVTMNINYGENLDYIWLVFNLQGAAAIALIATEVTNLLDIKNPVELRLFQIINLFVTVTIIYTRCFSYIFHCYYLFKLFNEEGAVWFLVVGGIACVLFFLFSLAFAIIPFGKRTIKFIRLSLSSTDDADLQKAADKTIESMGRTLRTLSRDPSWYTTRHRWTRLRSVARILGRFKLHEKEH